MPDGSPSLCSLLGLAALTLLLALQALRPERPRPPPYLGALWVFFATFAAVEHISFGPAIWILALFSFAALKEYFSLVDIRLQDRWGILAAYLSIPFMTWLIQTDWYGFFIVSIPVYAFLVVPFLVVLGGAERRGTVLSIGAIDLGLFLFVYCMGHIGYLTRFSTWLGMLLVCGVALCDFVAHLCPTAPGRPFWTLARRYLLAAPLPLGVSLLLGTLAGVHLPCAIVLGLLIPALVLMGNFTLAGIEADLGISADSLEPGRGRILDGLKSYLFTAPVVFHYLRYFTDVIE